MKYSNVHTGITVAKRNADVSISQKLKLQIKYLMKKCFK